MMKNAEKILIFFAIIITMMVIIYYWTQVKLDLGFKMSQVDINIVQSFDNVRFAYVG